MATADAIRQQLHHIVRSVSLLIFSALLFLPAVTVCLPCFLLAVVRDLFRKPLVRDYNSRCVVILAGAKSKALYLARVFKAEGYTVIMAESQTYWFSQSSFSRKVDKFYYLPRPDRHPDKYKSAILDIVKRHKPSLFIPIDPRAVDLDIEVISHLPDTCFPLTCTAAVFEELDNKARFMAALKKAGIRAPQTYHVTTKQEAYDVLKGKAADFVMKPVKYDNVARAHISPPDDPEELSHYLDDSRISPDFPYVIQEKLVGPELCSCSLVIGGQILVHGISHCSPVHQTFDNVQCKDVNEWLEDFVTRYPHPLTGWFTIDFMRSPVDGKYCPLECNPRFGSSFLLYRAEQGVVRRLQDAVTECRQTKDATRTRDNDNEKESSSSRPLTPELKQNYWLLNVLWVLLTHPGNMAVWRKYVTILVSGHEAVFAVDDPLPFLALNFLQIPTLVLNNLLGGQPWNIADYCIGTLKCG